MASTPPANRGQPRFAVTPRGLGTGRAGGAVPLHGGVVLSLERMNRIIGVYPADMIAVVDAFEAMTNGTPYRDRLGVERAIEEIRKEAGTQFDPEVVAALEKLGSTGNLPAAE